MNGILADESPVASGVLDSLAESLAMSPSGFETRSLPDSQFSAALPCKGPSR
jgi:hypothetical protein